MADREQLHDYDRNLRLIKHCWAVHKGKMRKLGLPSVTYSTFYHRVKLYKRTLYKAINTPADIRHRDYDRRRKAWFSDFIKKVKRFFIKLFKGGKEKKLRMN